MARLDQPNDGGDRGKRHDRPDESKRDRLPSLADYGVKLRKRRAPPEVDKKDKRSNGQKSKKSRRKN